MIGPIQDRMQPIETQRSRRGSLNELITHSLLKLYQSVCRRTTDRPSAESISTSTNPPSTNYFFNVCRFRQVNKYYKCCTYNKLYADGQRRLSVGRSSSDWRKVHWDSTLTSTMAYRRFVTSAVRLWQMAERTMQCVVSEHSGHTSAYISLNVADTGAHSAWCSRSTVLRSVTRPGRRKRSVGLSEPWELSL